MQSKCKKCGYKIQKNFKVCPNCGTKIVIEENENLQNKNKSTVSVVIIAICILIFVIYFATSDFKGLFGETKTETKYNTQKIYSINEVLHCPNFDVTIDDFKIKKKGTRIDDFSVISDPEWIGVILTVKNIRNKTHTFYTSNVSLTNTNGEILSHSVLTYKIWGAENLNSPELISGGVKKGYIQFSNNQTDNSNLILNVKCQTELFKDEIIYKVKLSK